MTIVINKQHVVIVATSLVQKFSPDGSEQLQGEETMLAAIVNSLSRHQINASEDNTVSAATSDRGTGIDVPLSDSTLPLSTDSRSNVGGPQATTPRFDARTRLLLDGPVLATLLRLATPNVLVMFVHASVGAGRLLWPLLANLMRLAIAAVGGWLALGWSGDLSHVFLALSAAFVVFGLMNAVAVAGGAWFGPIGWPRMPAALLQKGATAGKSA
jgi:hypothetical protein